MLTPFSHQQDIRSGDDPIDGVTSNIPASISYSVETSDQSKPSIPQSDEPDTKDVGISTSLSQDCSIHLELQPNEIHQSTVSCSQNNSEKASKLFVSPLTTDWSSLAKELLSILEGAVHARVIRAPVIPSRIPSSFNSTHLPIPHRSNDCGAIQTSSSMNKVDRPTSSHFIPPSDLPSQPDQFETRQDILSLSGAAVIFSKRTRSDDVCSGVVEGRARIAVLFSGGVDSAVLAALTDR